MNKENNKRYKSTVDITIQELTMWKNKYNAKVLEHKKDLQDLAEIKGKVKEYFKVKQNYLHNALNISEYLEVATNQEKELKALSEVKNKRGETNEI